MRAIEQTRLRGWCNKSARRCDMRTRKVKYPIVQVHRDSNKRDRARARAREIYERANEHTDADRQAVATI